MSGGAFDLSVPVADAHSKWRNELPHLRKMSVVHRSHVSASPVVLGYAVRVKERTLEDIRTACKLFSTMAEETGRRLVSVLARVASSSPCVELLTKYFDETSDIPTNTFFCPNRFQEVSHVTWESVVLQGKSRRNSKICTIQSLLADTPAADEENVD